MKYHGLVLLAVLGLSRGLWAQDGSAAPPRNGSAAPVPGNGEPAQIPGTARIESQSSAFDVESELQLFRNELRQFQSSREEVARNVKSTDLESERISMQQRQELINLLTKLARTGVVRKNQAKSRPAPEPPAAKTDDIDAIDESSQMDLTDDVRSDFSSDLNVSGAANPMTFADAADAFALGKVLFRNGDFVNAERAFRQAKVTPENEMVVKYLLATCLRRQSRWKQAIEAYKVIADSNQDPVLQKLAKWQIDNIHWHQESETQLQQLKKQRESQSEPKKPNATRKSGS